MTNFNKIILISFSLLLPLLLSGQSLDQLLEEAERNNLELKALYQEYLAALERAPQVSQLPDPEFGVGVFALPVETRLGPQWVRLSGTQLLPWKGTLEARKDLMLVMAKTQFERIAVARLEIAYKVKQAYFQWYSLEEKQKILQRSTEIFQALEQLTLSRVETGKGSLADVLQIQLREQEIAFELERLGNRKTKPLAAINQLLNRPPGTPLIPADRFEMAALPFNRDSLSDVIRNQHPAIRAFVMQQETSRQAISVNELEGKPSFGVGLDYIVVSQRTDAEPAGNGRDILSPRLAVRLPLYREKYRAKQQEEQIRIEALEIRKEDQWRQFMALIEQAFADVQDAVLREQLYRDQRSTAQQVVQILLGEYSAGANRFPEVLQLENQLLQYDLMILDAIVASHLAKAEIERYIP